MSGAGVGGPIYTAIGIFGIILGVLKELGLVIVIFQVVRLINYIIKNKCFLKVESEVKEKGLDEDLYTESNEEIEELD